MSYQRGINKIIVTGGSGFVGSHTIKALEELGHKVLNFDIRDKNPLDIRILDHLRVVIDKGDRVIHLAAVSRFADADNDPWLTHRTNVLGCENVARVCREMGADMLLYSSTGSVYMPVKEEPPITEEFQPRGNSQYGCSKYLGELAIKKHFDRHVIFRYAHLYGEGRMDHGAVGAFISRVNRGVAPTLFGGKQSNDFTYIKDIVQANVRAITSERAVSEDILGQVFNIGTGEEISTERVFEILAENLNYNGEIEKLEYRSVDPLRFVYDISKARELLGYNPQFSFEDGLKDYLAQDEG